MSNYLPSEVKDLTESKQRVMQNVVSEIQKTSRKPKHTWRYVVISAVLIMSTLLFVFNEVLIENVPQSNELKSPTELNFDLTEPTFTDEQGTLYLQGVTLGDSHEKVTGVLGENYTIVQEEDSEADFIMDYEGQARFYFNEDKLNSAVFNSVDERYFDELFKDYDGFKFFTSIHTNYDGHYFYSDETNQGLKALSATTDGNVQLSLYHHDTNTFINAEYLYKTEQKLNNQHQSQTDLNIDLTKPTFSEEQGHLQLHGVMLGDSPLKVIERFGDNYIIGQVDGDGSDFVLDYDKQASFSFYKDKLISVVLTKVDENYFDQLLNDYNGFKFASSSSEDNNDRFMYSKKTNNIIKATTQTPNQELYLYLLDAGSELFTNPDFLEAMEQQ